MSHRIMKENMALQMRLYKTYPTPLIKRHSTISQLGIKHHKKLFKRNAKLVSRAKQRYFPGIRARSHRPRRGSRLGKSMSSFSHRKSRNRGASGKGKLNDITR